MCECAHAWIRTITTKQTECEHKRQNKIENALERKRWNEEKAKKKWNEKWIKYEQIFVPYLLFNFLVGFIDNFFVN